MAIETIEDIKKRATQIAVSSRCSEKQNVSRALALNIIAMQAFENGGIESAKEFLTAAAITKNHQELGL